MLINEVEHIVGLSKKTIRYYEENGLLNPKRNKFNDYREYTEEDIKKLKLLKFLRELDVSINELKLLDKNKLTLEACMNSRIRKIEEMEDNYQKIKDMCQEISKSHVTYQNIDITKYLEQINVLKKQGFTMNNSSHIHRKKIIGSFISSAIFILFFIAFISIITYFQLTDAEKLPWVIFFFFIAFFTLPIIGIIYNLVIRIIEIKGGEEDDASKY